MNKAYIYLYDDMDRLDDSFIADNLHKLPMFRQEQCNRYRYEADKKACILAYLLLEQGLREQYGITNFISFIYNEHGKPYLQEYPQVFFNISHCKCAVVCALADFKIGVDIQDIHPYNINVARRACSKIELKQLMESESPDRLFCRMWTKKESYAKAKGISVADVLKKELPERMHYYQQDKNYCIALCHLGLVNHDNINIHKILQIISPG